MSFRRYYRPIQPLLRWSPVLTCLFVFGLLDLADGLPGVFALAVNDGAHFYVAFNFGVGDVLGEIGMSDAGGAEVSVQPAVEIRSGVQGERTFRGHANSRAMIGASQQATGISPAASPADRSQ